jgi:WD40 repeat protein
MILRGHDAALRSAAFSPDGKRIVTASLDMTARLWDAASGRELGVLRGHSEPVMSATFSKDGTRVVTASADGTTRVWRVFPTTQALIDYARSILPRGLAAEQRRQYFLDEAIE